MFYWLFTDGKDLLSSLIVPLLFFSLLLPILATVMLGAGIQRAKSGGQVTTRQQIIRVLAFLVPSLAVTSLYTLFLGHYAISHVPGKPSTNPFIMLLTGAPSGVNQSHLMTAGMMLIGLLFALNIGIFSGIRNGGWLREWIDRMRRPGVKRGEMGSAHFCTSREYRLYRRGSKQRVIASRKRISMRTLERWIAEYKDSTIANKQSIDRR